jgi:predicted metal-dependent enzyme (double-stranded beta helix superfamily)
MRLAPLLDEMQTAIDAVTDATHVLERCKADLRDLLARHDRYLREANSRAGIPETADSFSAMSHDARRRPLSTRDKA